MSKANRNVKKGGMTPKPEKQPIPEHSSAAAKQVWDELAPLRRAMLCQNRKKFNLPSKEAGQ